MGDSWSGNNEFIVAFAVFLILLAQLESLVKNLCVVFFQTFFLGKQIIVYSYVSGKVRAFFITVTTFTSTLLPLKLDLCILTLLLRRSVDLRRWEKSFLFSGERLGRRWLHWKSVVQRQWNSSFGHFD